MHPQSSSRDVIEILQTNFQSPQMELCSTTSRQMARSTYQRPKKIKKSTTISIFTQNQENDSPNNRRTHTSLQHLKRVFNQVFYAKIFINSLLHYQKQLSSVRTNQWHLKRESLIPFYPDDFIIKKWKVLIDVVTFCTVILYPIYICYDIKRDFDKLILSFGVVYFLDIILNCLTCYVDESHNLITDIRLIFRNYLSSWFVTDVLATLPLQVDNLHPYFVYFKMFRVIKYFLNKKIITYKGQFNHIRLQESFVPHEQLKMQTGTRYLINVLINACLLIHIFGCFEHFLEQYDYITCIYWATQTISTVGYGDVQANYILSNIWMLVGVTFYSFTIGDFALLISKSKLNQENDILFSIEQLSQSQDLPEKLKFSCLTFIKNNLTHNPLWLEEYKDMVRKVPYQIKNYLTISSELEFCLQIPFFLYDINYTQILLQNMRCIQVEAGQLLYREGQNSSEIFFLLKGSVKIMTKDKGLLLNILEGRMFGEFEAIEEKLRGTYCVAQTTSLCVVIPYRIFRKVMAKSQIIDFEVKQLHLRRRKLIINNFIEERCKLKLEYRKQNARFFTNSFIQMTRPEYELEKQKQQLLSITQYNNLLLQKILGKKRQRVHQFLIKFRRSVSRIIEMNKLLDETQPDLWKELVQYQLIKRVFHKKYLEDKYSILSISRKSSSVHSYVSRMKCSTFSQQYFFHKLPEVKLKHIVLSHIRGTKNKFIPLKQIIDKYQDDPEQIEHKQRENVERSKWTKQLTKITQTIILRVDQIEECGLKYFSILNQMKIIEQFWLKGSMQKFELFQLLHGKEKQFLI